MGPFLDNIRAIIFLFPLYISFHLSEITEIFAEWLSRVNKYFYLMFNDTNPRSWTSMIMELWRILCLSNQNKSDLKINLTAEHLWAYFYG